jgi:hypothetical protein
VVLPSPVTDEERVLMILDLRDIGFDARRLSNDRLREYSDARWAAGQ